MARYPKKIHVRYVNLDGIVNLQRTRQQMPGKPDGFFMEPSQIAETVSFFNTTTVTSLDL
jgi:hypothetical protein